MTIPIIIIIALVILLAWEMGKSATARTQAWQKGFDAGKKFIKDSEEYKLGMGYQDGYNKGYQEGRVSMNDELNHKYNEGWNDGYSQGSSDGWNDAERMGMK